MPSVDIAGYIASALVLTAFYMKDMVPLRFAAICSNLAFLIYGASMHLVPVIVLHTLLLPLNVWRLIAAMNRRRSRASAGAIKQ
jgi:hypothetical protein